MRLFYLQLLVFPIGVHYYASLVYNNPDGEYARDKLRHTLTAKDAISLNKADSGSSWKPGESSMRFVRREAAVEAALERAKEVAGDSPFTLFVGQFARCDPQEPVYSTDPDLLKELTVVWKSFELIGGWDGGQDGVAKRLCDEWDRLLDFD